MQGHQWRPLVPLSFVRRLRRPRRPSFRAIGNGNATRWRVGENASLQTQRWHQLEVYRSLVGSQPGTVDTGVGLACLGSTRKDSCCVSSVLDRRFRDVYCTERICRLRITAYCKAGTSAIPSTLQPMCHHGDNWLPAGRQADLSGRHEQGKSGAT